VKWTVGGTEPLGEQLTAIQVKELYEKHGACWQRMRGAGATVYVATHDGKVD